MRKYLKLDPKPSDITIIRNMLQKTLNIKFFVAEVRTVYRCNDTRKVMVS